MYFEVDWQIYKNLEEALQLRLKKKKKKAAVSIVVAVKMTLHGRVKNVAFLPFTWVLRVDFIRFLQVLKWILFLLLQDAGRAKRRQLG